MDRPLGLLYDVDAEILDRLRAVEIFDLDPLDVDLLSNPHPPYPPFHPDQLPAVKLDLRRFLTLRTLFDTTALPRIVPARRLDDAWHELIQHTHRYAEFCDTCLGAFFHHRPASEYNRPVEEIRLSLGAGLRQTMECFTRAYGPPTDWLWSGRQRWEPRTPSRQLLIRLVQHLQTRLDLHVANLAR